jgi:predicted nucleotidyltransferase
MKKIQFTKKQIKEFKEMGIEIIYLFGSRAQGFVSPLSDFDFGIVFERPEKYKDKTMKTYLRLYDIFTDVLPKEYLKRRFKMKEHEFDIVFLQFVPISLQFNAISTGKVIYEKSEKVKFAYQENVMRKHADLQYFYNLRYQAILERI